MTDNLEQFLYSLIASLLAFPVWKALTWLTKYCLDVMIRVSSVYSAVIYRLAARSIVENPIRRWLFIVPIFLIFLFMILLYTIDIRITQTDSILAETESHVRTTLFLSTKLLDEIREPLHSPRNMDSTQLDSSVKATIEGTSDLLSTVDSSKSAMGSVRRSLNHLLWLGGLVLLYVLIVYSQRIYIMDLVTDFQVRLLRLEPHFPMEEIVTLRSRWSLMKSKEDFELLMTDLGKMDEIANPHGRSQPHITRG